MKTLITILLILHVFDLSAYIKSNADVPQEFSFMLETLQNYPHSKEEMESLKSEITLLDTHLQYLSVREMGFILKSELYKGILHFSLGRDEVKLEDAEKLSLALREKQSDSANPFHQWLFTSFKQDLDGLIADKKFQKVLDNKKNRSAVNSAEEKVHLKKVQMILAWASFLSSSGEEELSTTLKPLLLSIIQKTSVRAQLFARLTKFNYSDKNSFPLKYFQFEEMSEKKAPTASEISKVESLILPPEVQELPKSDWKPAEDGPKLRAPAPDPNYTPPLILPKAKSSWD